MKLYTIPACPFVHRVLLTCHVRQIGEAQVRNIPIALDQPPAALLAINPSGSVPTLEVEPGAGFHESLIIMEFLDGVTAPGPRIYGNSPLEIAKTKVLWETINNQVLMPITAAIYSGGNINVLRAANEKLKNAWTWFDRLLNQHQTPFLGGQGLNAADIALAPFLNRLYFANKVQPAIEIPRELTPAFQYMQRIVTVCKKTGLFPDDSSMYQSALHFLTPHPLFNEVQNAPRTLLESPQSAVAQAGEQLSKWSVDFDGKGDCLKATFEFTSHADAVQKITWLHDAQEICDHHTSFTLKDFSAIDITLVTHEPRWGVTSKDICMAKLIQCYFTKGQLSE